MSYIILTLAKDSVVLGEGCLSWIEWAAYSLHTLKSLIAKSFWD